TDLMTLSPWSNAHTLRVVIETPRGSAVKVKLDPRLGAFTISRPLPEGMVYPFDFGFVPGTRAPDGDPLDAVVFWDVASWPGIVVDCRPLGVVELDQAAKDGKRRQRNDRLLVTPTSAARAFSRTRPAQSRSTRPPCPKRMPSTTCASPPGVCAPPCACSVSASSTAG